MRRQLLAVAALAAPLLVIQAVAFAGWVDSATASASYSTGSLAPPTNPATAAGICVVVVGDRIVVSWTATTSTWADGYLVARSTISGGPYTVVGTLSGQGTTTFNDGPLAFSTTYHYVVRATKGAWVSADTTQVSRTTKSSLCL